MSNPKRLCLFRVCRWQGEAGTLNDYPFSTARRLWMLGFPLLQRPSPSFWAFLTFFGEVGGAARPRFGHC